MTLWELAACIDGNNRANGAETKPDFSGKDADALTAKHYDIVKRGDPRKAAANASQAGNPGIRKP